MADADIKDDAPKQLGRITLKRRPAALILRPRDPVARHAQLLALSEKHGVPALDLDQVCLKTDDLANVPRDLAQHHILIPVLARPDRLFVAMRDPSQRDVIQEVEFVSGKHVYAYAAPPEDIAEAIEKAYLARERGDLYFIGASCPPETLRRAGLLSRAPEGDRVQPCMPPAIDLTQNEELPSRVEIVVPAEPEVHVDPGPPVTVSAIPPRLSSLPPALRGRGSDPGGEGEAVSAVETAFDDLFSEVSTVGPLPTEAVEPERGDKPALLLVVDADAESRDELARMLSDAGYGVRRADSGRAALAIIRERAPDLLLIAAVLPDVHGIEIARRLRGSQRYGGMPIVMIGAVDRGWRAAEDLKDVHDVDACVEKPLEKADVEQKVARALLAATPTEQGSELSQRAAEALADGMQAYRSGEIASAIQHLERGIAIDPLAYRLHLHLGLVLAQQSQIYDAIRALERAVEIKPQHFAGVKNLAILYFQAGFRNRAVELWQRGLELAPDSETRAAIEEHLAALLSQEGLS